MEEGNVAILVDAKTEYTKQLVNIISPNIFIGIKRIYNECKQNFDGSDVLYEFQILLSEIPKWNQEIINKEYENLIDVSHCDWLEDLLTAVFVSHTRILTSINFNKNKNKINLKIPKVDHFIHLCYIEVARNFWKNPYLFDETISKFEYQRNRRDAENIIETTINETIRKQLPVKHILKEYLGNEFKETSNNDISNSENDIEQENLRKMVKAEIENCSKEKLEKLNINSLYNSVPVIDSLSKELLDEDKETLSLENKVGEAEAEAEAEVESTSKETLSLENKVDAVEVEAEPSSKEPLPLENKVGEVEAEAESTSKETLSLENKVDAVEAEAEPASKETLSLETKVGEVEAEPSSKETLSLENTHKLDTKESTLSDEEIDVNNVINDEVNNLKLDSLDNNELKIETLNLNIDDDLSNLEEVYINEPVKNIESVENIEHVEPLILQDNNENKIKTVYIDTNEKKKKSSFNETDIEINYNESDDDSYKSRKYSKKDFNFFE
jgi:hypothetical protein